MTYGQVSVETDPSIRILGVPDVSSGGEAVVFPAKGFQLIALLALAPSGHITRKEVASYLWDSENEGLAFSNLRQLIARIKKAIPAGRNFLSIDASSIALGDGRATVDLCRFEMPKANGELS